MTHASVRPVLFGADYSVYVRIARLALLEKGVAHDLEPVDIFAPGGAPVSYAQRHPFLRIPSFSHGGLDLYETGAIVRYVDEAFDGPALQPAAAADRALMNQMVGIVDSYAYRAMVWDIYVETVSKPARGETPDAARVEAAWPVAERCLDEFARLKRNGTWLLGDVPSLADLYLAPVFAYFEQAPSAPDMIARRQAIAAWWSAMRSRESFVATVPTSV